MEKQFIRDLKGLLVVGASARMFGELVELEINTETKQLSGIVIVVKSSALADLGLEKKFWTKARISIPVVAIQSISDVVLLNITLEQYADLLGSATPEEHLEAEPISPQLESK